VSSTLNWQERGLSLEQVSDLAVSHHASFSIEGAPPAPVNVKFRKPSWVSSCQGVTMTVNCRPIEAVEASGFLGVTRVWQRETT